MSYSIGEAYSSSTASPYSKQPDYEGPSKMTAACHYIQRENPEMLSTIKWVGGAFE